MNPPLDQAQRDRFRTELDRNFSIVASAGSGKTRAITDRIIAIAKSPHALEWLPSLVVVTFTNRAADEMQQRARQQILEQGVPLDVLAAFNRTFFGTIHSFCVKLLRQHGYHLHLPGTLDLLTDDAMLWMEFLQQHIRFDAGLSETQRGHLLRLVPVRTLMELGRSGGIGPTAALAEEFPALAFEELYAVAGKGSAKRTIGSTQERLRQWETAWQSGEGFLPFPDCATTSKDFVPLWDTAFAGARRWVQSAALCVAAEIESAYRVFRVNRGAIDYDDQVTLASALLRVPEAARRIRAKNYRVILDEAQDTDPTQFDTLLEITRPPEAEGAWLETQLDPPRPGHFCMVGDFQQSIFGSRADLPHYQRVHDALLGTGGGEELKFSVTFRLDEKVIDSVNALFPTVLHGKEGQVDFVRLQPRPDVLPGQVLRAELGPLPDTEGWRDRHRARFEARQLAHWLRQQGLEKLRATHWSEVAVLCPRKGWFPALRDALRGEGFDVQLQSERDQKGDGPAYAWFTALTVIMAEPDNGYEIAGVLREVFGLSDHDLAVFCEDSQLHLFSPPGRTGPVGQTLRLLVELRERIAPLPLYTAMQEVVRTTQLRDRLLALPAEDFGDLAKDLEDFLTLAATAEADGQTLTAFAEQLRTNFGATREVRTHRPGAIQLITSHKAKGSEWAAVVLPFLGRNVVQRAGDYPRLIRHPSTEERLAALESADIDSELKELLDLAARQEMERLLYVALTRAKHTLVLVDDRALFTGKNGLPKNALLRRLRCAPDDANALLFDALPTAPTSCAPTQSQQTTDAERRTHDQIARPLPDLTKQTLPKARGRASLFLKRNPSALAEAALAEANPAAHSLKLNRPAAAPNQGQRYGTWWHEFVERIDWSNDRAQWEKSFLAEVETSPDPALSQKEWPLLLEQLSGETELNRWLTGPGKIAHAELPFLWSMSASECLDGIIDLCVFDPGSKSWLILDWKTNRTTLEKLPDLRAHYLPQLSAYWHTARAIFDAPVTAGIYSTATGRWLPYETSELQASWEKLRQAPDELERVLGEP